ncbi:unnamed protein product, partial [Symbiodinium pilosum]
AMEILLKDTKGVSPETIISIRAGTTRRQVPVSLADKPFKFPCQLAECGAIKVDLMTVTASARAILQAEGEQDVEMKMIKKTSPEALYASEEAQISLLVRSSSGEAPAMSHEERAAKKKAMASATEEYLHNHGVLTFIQGVLQGIIRDRPDDPYKYVADQFASASVSKKDTPTVEEMRQTARDALLHGAKSGKLLEVLRQGTSPKASSPSSRAELPQAADAELNSTDSEVDQLRQVARDALLKGAQSGKLFDVLAESSAKKAEARKKAQAKDVDQLRQQAKNLLLEGAQSGKLMEVLQGAPLSESKVPTDDAVKQTDQPDVAVEPRPEADTTDQEAEEIDALRQQARDLLLEGAQSGKLQEVLGGAQQPASAEVADDVDKLRQQAREALLEAEEIDALRQQARDLLLEGAQSGKLQEVLGGAQQPASAEAADDVDKLRQQAREALLAGAQSGKLFEVLSTNIEQNEQPKKPAADDDMDDLRRQAREALLLGAQSGKLMELLAKNSEQRAASKRNSAESPDELELLRQQAREALIQGAQSGRLLEVLAKPDEAEEMFQLKKKLCDAIAGSMETGELTEALKEVHDLRTQEIWQEASDALRDGAESGKVLQMLAEKAGADDGAPKATLEVDRAEAVELALQRVSQCRC